MGGSNLQKVFEAGTAPTATVSDWLKWAEVDLDLPADEGVNAQWLTGEDTFLQGPSGAETGEYPHLRISGSSLTDSELGWVVDRTRM